MAAKNQSGRKNSQSTNKSGEGKEKRPILLSTDVCTREFQVKNQLISAHSAPFQLEITRVFVVIFQDVIMSLDSWGDALSKVFWVRLDQMRRWVAKCRGIGRIDSAERAVGALCREFTGQLLVFSSPSQKINCRACQELSIGIKLLEDH